VEVAARGAHRGTAVERGLVAADRQDDLVDLVARALVIDDGARTELGDGQEPRAAQEVVGLARGACVDPGKNADSGKRGKL
jgi:hypothetical protein